MDHYRDVLLGASLREKMWPIIESNAMYDDVIPWLQANRCPRMYTDTTILAANDYGIYNKVNSYNNNFVYEGEWVEGKRHGQGTCTYAWPNSLIYVGEWKGDERHGQGKETYANGNFYEGSWLDNKRHGQGTLTFANGGINEGALLDGKGDGRGKFTYPDGTVYEGDWIDDKNEGTLLLLLPMD